MRKCTFLVLTLLLLSLPVACNSILEVGIERTPTPDHGATATLAALATENARLATQVATLATPTPTVNLGKVAYLQGGDIWVKVLPDGETQRLTTDGRSREPRWSPSGQWLAFRKGDYQVWVMRADGTADRPVNEGATAEAFAWAPTGDQLAYVTASAELCAINADGTDPLTLVPQTIPGRGPGRVERIAWSPDGAWIAYEWRVQQPDQPPTYQGLWKASTESGERNELYISGVPEKGEAILAGWSSDGRFLLFWQGDVLSASLLADGVPLFALSAEGGTPVQLAPAVLVYADCVVPKPSGTDQVAILAGGSRNAWVNKALRIAMASTRERVTVTSSGLAVSSPAWSPEGQRIAYVAMPDRRDLVGGEPVRQALMQRRLWVVNTQGEPQPRQLTDDQAYRDERPLWSAAGSHILFVRLDADGRASLWLIPAEGGKPRPVVDELTPAPEWFGYYGHVDWDGLLDWWQSGLGVQQMQPEAWRTYTDAALGFAIDYPAGWDVDGIQGAFVWLSNPATSGEERQAINIAAHAEPNLEAMLDNVEQGFGPYMLPPEPVQLGGLEALKITLQQAPEGLSLLWLVITAQSQQQGQGMVIAAYGESTLAEAIVATWRPFP